MAFSGLEHYPNTRFSRTLIQKIGTSNDEILEGKGGVCYMGNNLVHIAREGHINMAPLEFSRVSGGLIMVPLSGLHMSNEYVKIKKIKMMKSRKASISRMPSWNADTIKICE